MEPPPAPPVHELATTLLAAIDSAGHGLAIVLQRGTQLEWLFQNRHFGVLTGYHTPPANPFDLIAADERARMEELIAGHATGLPLPSQFETTIRHADGHDVPVEISLATVPLPTGIAIVGFLRDIGERQGIARALRDSEARFRSLAEASPDSITVVSRGRFLYANPAAATVLGFDTPAELMARPFGELLVDAGETQVMIERMGRVARGEKLPPREYGGRRKDGSVAVMEISTSPVVYDGEPALLAFGRDTTERRTLHAELLRSDRLATIGMLAASVAHEINNPLTYTLINLDRLTATVPALIADPEQRRQVEAMLADARDGGERVRNIVRELLSVARHDHAIGPVAIEAAVDTAIRLAGPSIADRVRITRTGVAVPPVRGNAARLSQVFLNLVLNAADAFDRADPRNQVLIEVGRDHDQVVVTVTDNGTGIPAEVRDRIFEPLFTTKPVGAGTGLGLSICKSIVTELAGTISASAGPDGGTRMTVRLPIADPASARSGSAEGAATPPSIRVAVIDDDVRLAEAIGQLVRLRHQAEVYTDARAALDRLTAEPAFDHVLCDLNMPGLGGVDLYLELRERRPEYGRRFTFITGGAPEPRADALVAGGEVGFLAKPFDRGALLATIERRTLTT